MNCPTCGSTLHNRRDIYKYSESGLNNVYLQNVIVASCSNFECEEKFISIPRIIDLHKAIAMMIIGKLPKKQREFVRKEMKIKPKLAWKCFYTGKQIQCEFTPTNVTYT